LLAQCESYSSTKQGRVSRDIDRGSSLSSISRRKIQRKMTGARDERWHSEGARTLIESNVGISAGEA